MAYTNFAFRYTSGKAANLAALIWSQDRTKLRTGTGTTLSTVSAVADASYSTGRLAAAERLSSNGTGTGTYYLVTFPVLPAAFYVIEVYDVTTPASASPSPSDVPLSSSQVYWDGSTLIDGVQTVLFSTGALSQISGISSPSAGSDTCTMTITNLGVPVADADVWISTDQPGVNVVAGTKQTNDDGEATFLLDHGLTYYLFAQKAGVVSLQGVSFVAQAD